MDNILKQGQRVKYQIADLSGYGKVVGAAQNPQPIIGTIYIIEPDIPIKNEVYDYTHFVAPEVYLKVVDENFISEPSSVSITIID